ncbi:coiled-coil domain-containing protein 69-like isoform X1 [Ruditapes philippinarum]|uniref:coiled-coil domain-containing protein 69-like isoform X1 n=1 Tax=Ruditapes philippinarum TaxID=129788 RepID=UPI00295C0B1A|nr:coiled-coil domain-containing protein 69-like isoform X1 [Ruditapes philippinarum]
MDKKGFEGENSFRNMFHRKKKDKSYLLTALKQLTIATEEQVSVIKSLTDQNKIYQDWHQVQETLLSKAAELQKLKDQNETLQENLVTTLERLEKAKEEIFAKEEREQHFEEANNKLSEDLKLSARNLAETQTQLALYQERFKYADEENKALKTTSEKYKVELEAIKSEFVDEHMKSKLLEQEVVYHTEMMEFNNKARLEMTRQLEDMRETMRKERIGAISTELSIDAENECLKFDVHSLSKEIKKLSEQLTTIQHEKVLMMSYYTRQLNERATVSHQDNELRAARAITINTTDGCLSLGSTKMAEEMHPDVPENITLKNKLMDLENKLFRREQLIEELVANIKDKDPDFNIQNDPNLKIYLDASSSQISLEAGGVQCNNSSNQTLHRARNHHTKNNSASRRLADKELCNTSKEIKRHKSYINNHQLLIVK